MMDMCCLLAPHPSPLPMGEGTDRTRNSSPRPLGRPDRREGLGERGRAPLLLGRRIAHV